MCTGQRAFQGRDAVEVAVAQARGVPRADAVDPSLPRALADLIARAMAIDVDQRFESAAEIDAALEDVERSLGERPRSRREQLKRTAVRTAIGLPVAVAALTMVGLITTARAAAIALEPAVSGPSAGKASSQWVFIMREVRLSISRRPVRPSADAHI